MRLAEPFPHFHLQPSPGKRRPPPRRHRGTKPTVDIPAGELAEALQELSRQYGIQILYDPDLLRGRHAPAVSGSFTVRQALERLLTGSSLDIREYGHDSFLILPTPTQSGPSESQGPMPLTVAGTTLDAGVLLEEVQVTGTHIRNQLPVGAALSTYDRADFDLFGSATVESLGRDMLENFAGTDALATLNTNGNVGNLSQGAAINIFAGTGFDLLGLGPDATLTLIDGHRIAPGGLDGSIVDVSLIPLSAIDHLEVMTDGGSAIYGSDAVAGVINIVTRRAWEGAETSVRFGQSTDGGAGHSTASQLFGRTWTTGNALIDYEYDDQQGLDASQRSWIAPENGTYSLLPESHRHSLFLSGTQDIATLTTFSLSSLYSTREFKSDGLQLSTDGFVPDSAYATGHANLLWSAATIDRELPSTWDVTGTATYSSMKQLRSAAVFPDGPSGAHFDNTLDADSDITDVELEPAVQSGVCFEPPSAPAIVQNRFKTTFRASNLWHQ